jgi:hypothetical protein
MVGLRLQEPPQDRVLVFSSEPGLGETFAAFRSWYGENGHKYRWVGFNSLAYDNHIVGRILAGADDPATLHTLSDTLVNNNDWRRDILASAGGEISIDPFAMNGGAKARVGSLKECACKLDAPSLRTLPYAPDRVLTRDEMRAVVEYNRVDLEVTALVAACQADKVAARIALAREYRLPRVINVHDAKLAELVLAQRLFGTDYPKYPTVQNWLLLGRQVTEAFSYRTAALQEMVARIPETMRFEVTIAQTDDGPVKQITPGEIADSVKVGEVTYSLGTGGLHSDDKPGLFVADERWTFLDLDVDSFYPALIVNHKLVPAHLPNAFLQEFDELRHKRLQAKSAGQTDLANGLKIAINSIFGKSKSPYSWLCDPTVTVRTTLFGQLTLLWLIDALVGVEGVEVISANTDGLTIKVRRDLVEWIKREMNRAASLIDMTLSWSEYRLIARRDVNNYVAVPASGGAAKCKGSYGYDRNDLGKKATSRIVVDAVRAYFVTGTPIAETIRACADVREFLDYFKATKGYIIVDGTGHEHGGIARWYLGTNGVRLLKKKLADGKLTQLVAAGATVVPDLPTTFPADVDFEHYIAAGETLVRAITRPEIKHSHTIPLAELSKAQRELLEANKAAPADPERCAGLDLEKYHTDWANVVRGNPHDTMLALMCRLWISQRGTLTRGDLVWAAGQLDEAANRVPEKHRIVDWIVSHVPPFPLPQTIPQHVARAMTWAVETIKPNQRKRALAHTDVLDSDFVKGDALRRYEKAGDVGSRGVRDYRTD